MHQSTPEIVSIAALWISATDWKQYIVGQIHCGPFAQWNTIQWRK